MSYKIEVLHGLDEKLRDARTLQERDKISLQRQQVLLEQGLLGKGPGTIKRSMRTWKGRAITVAAIAGLASTGVLPAAATAMVGLPAAWKFGLLGAAWGVPKAARGAASLLRWGMRSRSDSAKLRRIKRQLEQTKNGERRVATKMRPQDIEVAEEPVRKTKIKKPKKTVAPNVENDATFEVVKPEPVPVAQRIDTTNIPLATAIPEAQPVTTPAQSPFSAESFGPGPTAPLPPRQRASSIEDEPAALGGQAA